MRPSFRMLKAYVGGVLCAFALEAALFIAISLSYAVNPIWWISVPGPQITVVILAVFFGPFIAPWLASRR